MRILAAIFLSGCSLYFGSPGPAPHDHGDPGPDSGGVVEPGATMARCEDGQIYAIDVPEFSAGQPGHGAGHVIDHCPGACQSAAVVCTDAACSNAAATLCNAPLSSGKACSLQGGACSGTGTLQCPQATTCGQSFAGATCGCEQGVYVCNQPTTSLQQSLVGKWRGTVTPPNFAQPYQVSLWIYPDGTYWAQSEDEWNPVFYYGGDGPHPERKISLLSISPNEGAQADIGIYFGSSPANTGAIQSLVASSTKLQFAFYASWGGCNQPFFYDLTRE